METDVEIELRIAEVKAAVDLGNAQQAGSISLLIQGAANDRERLAEHQEAVKIALAQVAADRKTDQDAQARKDADQEARLRRVDPLPEKVEVLEAGHAALVAMVRDVMVRQAKWSGGAIVAATIVSTVVGYVINR
jgi:hypothetical protein